MTTLLSKARTDLTPRSSRVALPSMAFESATTQASAAVRSSPDWEASPSPSPVHTSSSESASTTLARQRLSARRSRVNCLKRSLSATGQESLMIRSFVRGIALLVLPGLLQAQDVARQLRHLLPGGDTVVAIAFVQPATGRHAFLGADIRLHAASTMKVPVLIELARRVDAGDLQWEDRLPVENRFASIADSSDFSVDAADDSDSLPYTSIGATATVAELARHMTVRSSNLATDILIQRLGADR